ncbi:hypothetical protein BU15DRAFT_64407 [Melanogaster broomeanus]|nr:hypothetical protein BU15DRAFT_64407 [Melanogaster broomeanus]
MSTSKIDGQRRGGRYTHAEAILGPELCDRLAHTKVLLVGAGGIGCELLKNIILTGFGHITLLDLDTIDLSNLNRQFLFKKKDVKQSKAIVAAHTAGALTLISTSSSNALDNLAGVPLVESGTAGYLGQVQPLLKDRTECFDCIPKPAPKSFPVCTIRSTPSQPIHCIVWAKSYLLPQLFGEDEDGGSELDEAEKQGENSQHVSSLRIILVVLTRELNLAQEIAALRKEALAYKAVRISFVKDPTKNGATPVNSKGQPNGHINGDATASNSASQKGNSGLKDQRALSLQDNLSLFVSSGEQIISFDKDDDDTLDFVTAASNLRSAAYYIERKTRWEVKEMAGNIIPAIADNECYHLGPDRSPSTAPFAQFKPSVLLKYDQPLPTEPQVRNLQGHILKNGILGDGEGEAGGTGKRDVSVYEDKRVLSDPDWDDNLERTLESLSVTRGKFLTIVDEEGKWGTIAVALCELPPNHPADGPALVLPSSLPKPPYNSRPPTPAPPAPSRKRSAPDDEVSEVEPSAKRAKPNGTVITGARESK